MPLTISPIYKYSYYPLCIAIYFLIFQYSASNNTNLITSLIMIFILFSESLYFESVFLFFALVMVFVSYTYKIISLIKSFNILSVKSCFTQFVSLLFIQFTGFQNVILNNLTIEEKCYELLGFDVFILMNRFIHFGSGIGKSWFNEFHLTSKLFYFVLDLVTFK